MARENFVDFDLFRLCAALVVSDRFWRRVTAKGSVKFAAAE